MKWFVLLKGIILLLLGYLFVSQPEAALRGMTLYLGILLLIGGIAGLMYTHRMVKLYDTRVIGYIVPGVITASGLILLFAPSFALFTFSISIALWLLFDGLSQIRLAREFNGVNKNFANGVLIGGVITLILSAIILYNPEGFAKFMTLILGIIMLISGIFLLSLAFKLK